MVYVLLGTGFEEIEALTPVDLLRRAGVEVKTVGLNGKIVYGSHAIGVEAVKVTDAAGNPETIALGRETESISSGRIVVPSATKYPFVTVSSFVPEYTCEVA